MLSESELNECIEIVRECRMISPSPIGPLHGAGWNDAIHAVEKRLQERIDALRTKKD
jgi:hypothetical protein